MDIKTYAVNTNDAWPQTNGDDTAKSYVKFADYASLFAQFETLKAERDALADRVNALVVENQALKDMLESICCRDNEPKYHDCGMGCGLEDRGITDRYAAMEHGWESAMERIYEEVIPLIDDLPETPATSAALAALQAQGVEKFVTKISKQLREAGGERGYNLVDWCEYADHLEDRGEKFAAELREAK